SILEATGLPGNRLGLEITESALMEGGDVRARLIELRGLGVRLLLDDFGTGYSSLSYLHRFELDGLKLDRSFISQLGCDPSGSKLVAASIEMARALDLTVVAEGVETEQQLERLRELSCPLAQGYLFARPAPAQELEATLQRRSPTQVAEQASLA
ncbi:MAG: EAL domain-containing protein, partial [Gammaproteobacteria bacterium]